MRSPGTTTEMKPLFITETVMNVREITMLVKDKYAQYTADIN